MERKKYVELANFIKFIRNEGRCISDFSENLVRIEDGGSEAGEKKIDIKTEAVALNFYNLNV